MLVKELIEKLSAFDPDLEVAGVINDPENREAFVPACNVYQSGLLHREVFTIRDGLGYEVEKIQYIFNGPAKSKVVVVSFD
jgi:hypothetical protein